MSNIRKIMLITKNIIIGIIILVFMTIFIISCVIWHNTYQSFKTERYEVYVPQKWTVEELPGYTLSFNKGKNILGGIQILGYYPDEPISHIFPNHSETVYYKEISGFFTDIIQAKFKITPPAASQEDWAKEQIHIYFLIKDDNIAYDLWGDTYFVDEKTILAIARSFRLKY